MNSSFLLMSALAILCGFLAQQTVETVVNTFLTVLPFKIQTVK